MDVRRLKIFRKDVQPKSRRAFLLPSMDALWLGI